MATLFVEYREARNTQASFPRVRFPLFKVAYVTNIFVVSFSSNIASNGVLGETSAIAFLTWNESLCNPPLLLGRIFIEHHNSTVLIAGAGHGGMGTCVDVGLNGFYFSDT